MDQEVKASGFLQGQLGKDAADLDQALDAVAAVFLAPAPENADGDEDDEESGEEGSDAEAGEEAKAEEDDVYVQ